MQELETKNIEISDLKRKVSEFNVEKAELKCRIAEALKLIEKISKWRDAENVKLKARIKELEFENVEFRNRFTKVK